MAPRPEYLVMTAETEEPSAEKSAEPSAEKSAEPSAEKSARPMPQETTMQLPRVRDIGPEDPTIQLPRVREPQGIEPETNELPRQLAEPGAGAEPGSGVEPRAEPRAGAGPEAAAEEEGLTCPNCGQPIWPDDNFCQSCRTDLSPAVTSGTGRRRRPPVPTARTPTISPEGYCESCGYKVPSGRDHVDSISAWWPGSPIAASGTPATRTRWR